MKELLSELILLKGVKEDPVLNQIASVVEETGFYKDDTGASANSLSSSLASSLRSRLYSEVHTIMEVATNYGFQDNLWASYISFLLMTDENPLALVSEKREMPEASAAHFLDMDLEKIYRLLHYDFSDAEKKLNTDCMSTLQNYQAVEKNDRMYFSFISKAVNEVREKLMTASSEGGADSSQNPDISALHQAVKDFYRDYGVGMFGLNKAFRIRNRQDGTPELVPINNLEQVRYDDLLGYEYQKQLIRDNTRAFVEGKAANNMLLYGDAGTGKSTSVKATLNEFYPQGLRLIEIYKHQFQDLSFVISTVKSRNYKFIIFMDDLSFEEFEIEYKYLKAVIEGGFETKPDNIMIVATSNRRHLIKENLSDRKDMVDQEDIHHSDTIEEKLSLVDRFGLNILFSRPTYDEYHQIVLKLAKKHGIQMPEDELIRKANTWSVRKGGYTGRIAQQFINSLAPEL